MNIISILTIAAQFAASASVGAVVGNVIGVKTPLNAKPITKASIAFGTFILSSIASDMAMTYVETQIKEITNTLALTKEAVEEQIVRTQEDKKEGEG